MDYRKIVATGMVSAAVMAAPAIALAAEQDPAIESSQQAAMVAADTTDVKAATETGADVQEAQPPESVEVAAGTKSYVPVTASQVSGATAPSVETTPDAAGDTPDATGEIPTTPDDTAPVEDDGVADGTYVIQSGVGATKVLDVASGSSADRANVQTYDSNMSAAQRWTITHEVKDGRRTGYVTISAGTSSGKVLDVAGGTAVSGTNVWQYQSNGTKAQLWRLVAKGGGYVLYSALGNDLVLDVSGGSTANGANVQVYAYNGTNSQLFRLLGGSFLEAARASEAPADDEPDYSGTYVIRSAKDQSFALDVAGARDANGTNVQLYRGNGTFAQEFTLEREAYQGKVAYRLRNLATDTVLDVSAGNLVPTTNVQGWACAGANANQLFWVRANGDAAGSVTLYSVANGLALDIASGLMANGANVQTYTPNGTAAQRFVLSTPSQLWADGLYELGSRLSGSARVDVVGGSTATGAGVQVYSSNGTLAQKWSVRYHGDGTYTLESVCSGKYLSGSGSAVRMGEDGTAPSALWKVSAVRHGAVVLTNVASGKVLDVSGGRSANGTPIGLYQANGTEAQWFVPLSTVPLSDGYYRIKVSGSGLAVDVSGGSWASGAAVQAYANNGTAAQEWRLRRVSGSTYVITNAQSDLALDVLNARTANGSPLQQWGANGSAAQLWTVRYAGGGSFEIVSNLAPNLKLSASASLSSGSRLYVTRTSQGSGQTFGFAFLGTSRPPEVLTARQRRMVSSAYSTGPTPGGYCAAWVSNVTRNAGFGYWDGNANDLYWRYGRYSNLKDLQAGMMVAVSTHGHSSAGRVYGHVGVYVGNGKIRDSVYGYVRESDITWWVRYYGDLVTPKWGWMGNVDLRA